MPIVVAGTWGLLYTWDANLQVSISEALSSDVYTPIVESIPIVVSWSDTIARSMVFDMPVDVSESIYAEPIILAGVEELLSTVVDYADTIGFVDRFSVVSLLSESVDVSMLVPFSLVESLLANLNAHENIVRHVYTAERLYTTVSMSESYELAFDANTIVQVGEAIVVSKGTSVGLVEALSAVVEASEAILRGDVFSVSVSQGEVVSIVVQKVHTLQVQEQTNTVVSASF